MTTGTGSPPDARRLAHITIKTDGGPWADHDMPCAVCRVYPAVLNLDCGLFEPCWGCQQKGWQTRQRRRWWRRER